jgi:micrococcal nuclease
MKIEYTANTIEPITPVVNPDLYTYNARVIHIVDGDTLDVMVDLGFRTFVVKRLRLARINCPEMNTINGLKAAEQVEHLLPTNTPITFKSTKLDKYGRSIAEVYYKGADNTQVNLSDFLVRQTFAILQTY